MERFSTLSLLSNGADKVALIEHGDRKLVLKSADPSLAGLRNPNELLPAQILHPNMVKIESLLPRSSGRGLGMTMACGDRNLLEHVLYHCPSPRERLSIAYQLLGVVARLHDLEVLHLDLKPDNVVLREGRPQLIDFGHARRATSLTTSNLYMTVMYSPPEIFNCSWDRPYSYGKFSDVWSLGVTLYFLFCGRSLFPSNDKAEMQKYYQQHLSTPLDMATTLGRQLQCPQQLALLTSMLSMAPASRPSLWDCLALPLFDSVRAPVPECQLVEPQRHYCSASPALGAAVKSIIEYYRSRQAGLPVANLFLAVDIFYRAAFLGVYTDDSARTATTLPYVAASAAYIAVATHDNLSFLAMTNLKRHFSVEAEGFWCEVVDAVLSRALMGVVYSAHLYQRLTSSSQVVHHLQSTLACPEKYFALDVSTQGTCQEKPYAGNVGSLKFFLP